MFVAGPGDVTTLGEALAGGAVGDAEPIADAVGPVVVADELDDVAGRELLEPAGACGPGFGCP